MKETDPRFVNIKKKVLLFFVVAFVGIAATAVFIGIEHGVLIPKYSLSFTVERGTGFFEGMPVKLSGFKIGKIEKLSLDETAKVRITLLIYKKYQKWIRHDSIAVLMKEGIIGDTIIEITVGSPARPVLHDGAEIRYEKTSGYEELVEEIKPVLSDIRNIISYVNDPKGDLKQTLGNLRSLTAELHTTRENLDRLLKNSDKNISSVESKVSNTLGNIDTLSGNIGKTVAGIEDKLIPALDKLNRTMDSAEKTASGLKDVVDKSAFKVPALLDKGEDALNDTKEVVKSLKQVWPVRLYIEETGKEGILKGDSYE